MGTAPFAAYVRLHKVLEGKELHLDVDGMLPPADIESCLNFVR